MATSLVQIRVDETLKAEATVVYEQLGIDLPTAVRMFLRRSVLENGIPFDMKIPNESKTEAAIAAMKELSRQAEINGTKGMSIEEIDKEIVASRRERKEVK